MAPHFQFNALYPSVSLSAFYFDIDFNPYPRNFNLNTYVFKCIIAIFWGFLYSKFSRFIENIECMNIPSFRLLQYHCAVFYSSHVDLLCLKPALQFKRKYIVITHCIKTVLSLFWLNGVLSLPLNCRIMYVSNNNGVTLDVLAVYIFCLFNKMTAVFVLAYGTSTAQREKQKHKNVPKTYYSHWSTMIYGERWPHNWYLD